MGNLSDYDYHLPSESIAQTPLEDRAASRLLILDKHSGHISHHQFRDCLDVLQSGDLLVMNDTRVTARRLIGNRPTGGEVEALLIKELAPQEWACLVRPGKRLKTGSVVEFPNSLRATVLDILPDGQRILSFSEDPSSAGRVPLPPYITEHLADAERYQTVYARQGGSSAAPTAGLHFTSKVLEQLHAKGIQTATITLDVGLDTFRPVQTESLDEHEMHGERCHVPAETIDAIQRATGRIIAVGTTTVRTLESMAIGKRELNPGEMTTTIFIRPGYDFQIVDGMFTNFHMPRTTMLMMLSAMAGRENVLRAYASAITQGYRFLSFGDSMLIL